MIASGTRALVHASLGGKKDCLSLTFPFAPSAHPSFRGKVFFESEPQRQTPHALEPTLFHPTTHAPFIIRFNPCTKTQHVGLRR